MTADQVRSAGIEVAEGQELVDRTLLKTGNRDVDGFDFYWFLDDHIQSRDFPLEVFTAEREEWGNFYGTALGIEQGGKAITMLENGLWTQINIRLDRKRTIKKRIKQIEKKEMGGVNYRL